MRQNHLQVTDFNEIDVVSRERTNRRVRVFERVKKGVCIHGFRSECRNTERMRTIEQRKQLFRPIKLFNRKDECIEHPRFGRSHILRMVLQSWLERKAARREHSRIINRFREQSLKGSGRHGNERTVRLHACRVKSLLPIA